jgi:pimeloyl-ACP methyl ester carboxylesterase
MDSRFRRREIANNEVRLSYLDNDGGGPVTLAGSWIGHLEPSGNGGGLVPPFDAHVMQEVMEGVSGPRWEKWKSVTAPTTAVFAAQSMFSPGPQAEFVAARPGTRHVVLTGGSHDAHLDATTEWAAVLAAALDD